MNAAGKGPTFELVFYELVVLFEVDHLGLLVDEQEVPLVLVKFE